MVHQSPYRTGVLFPTDLSLRVNLAPSSPHTQAGREPATLLHANSKIGMSKQFTSSFKWQFPRTPLASFPGPSDKATDAAYLYETRGTTAWCSTSGDQSPPNLKWPHPVTVHRVPTGGSWERWGRQTKRAVLDSFTGCCNFSKAMSYSWLAEIEGCL